MVDLLMSRQTFVKDKYHDIVLRIPFEALKESGLRLSECEESLRDNTAELFGQACVNKEKAKGIKQFDLLNCYQNLQFVMDWVDSAIEEGERDAVENVVNFAVQYLDNNLLTRMGLSQREYVSIKDIMVRWLSLRVQISNDEAYFSMVAAFSNELEKRIVELMTE